jgi:hypothetical protein
MKVSRALATTALLLLSLIPARAGTIYPTQPCRVYEDTAFVRIPGQCGTAVPFYPRRLFVRAVRKPWYYYCP